MAKYKISDKAADVIIPTNWDKNGKVTATKTLKGIYAFGPQCDPFTDENLSDSVAEYLLGKDEYKDLIIKTESKK